MKQQTCHQSGASAWKHLKLPDMYNPGGGIVSVPEIWLMLFLLLSAVLWINWYFGCFFLTRGPKQKEHLVIYHLFVSASLRGIKRLLNSQNTHTPSPKMQLCVCVAPHHQLQTDTSAKTLRRNKKCGHPVLKAKSESLDVCAFPDFNPRVFISARKYLWE